MIWAPLSPPVKAALISLLISLLYIGILEPLRLFEIPKLKTQDLFFCARHFYAPKPALLGEFVVVTIDDEAIGKLAARKPHERRVYAEALEKITAQNPRLVGLDLIFAGASEPSDDFLLAEAIQKSGSVVLASLVDSKQNYIQSLPDFRGRALASGVVNKLLDRDLYVRRASLFYRDEKGQIISWPWEIEILAALKGLDRERLQIKAAGILFERENVFIPLYNRSGVKINYRFNLNDVDRMPLWQVAEGKDLADRFKGKIVLLGAASRILHDDYLTPLGLMPGVIVNMNFVVNLLTRDFIKKIPLFWNGLFLFIFVFLGLFLGLREDVVRRLIALGAVTAGFLCAFFALFLFNYLGDCFTPFVAGWFAFGTSALYRYVQTLIENAKLRGKVATDPLTGLYNRRVLESRIDTELEKIVNVKGARKTDPLYELSILMIDIDNFKKINDEYGHQFGDDVLKNISFSIKDSIRKDDLAARFGGEEFCVVLPHTSKTEAAQLAEKIRRNVEAKKFNYVNRVASFTVSIGVASAKSDTLLASRSLIRGADLALYQAKKAGKNRVCLCQGGG